MIKIISVAIATLFFGLNVAQAAIATDIKNQLWPKFSDKTICRLANSTPRTDGYFYGAALRGLNCGDAVSVAVTFPVSSKAVCESNDSLKWHNCLGRLPVTTKANSVYIGEWLDGKYHGSGMLIDNHRGGVFVSEWKKGARTGPGRFWYLGDYPSGKDIFGNKFEELYIESFPSQRYQGSDYIRAFQEHQYEDTSTHKLVYLDGSIYRGDFKTYPYTSTPFGSGARTYLDGKVVSGTWEFGELKSKTLPSVHYRAMYEANSINTQHWSFSNKRLCHSVANNSSWPTASDSQLTLIMRGMLVKNCRNRTASMSRIGDPSKLLLMDSSESFTKKTTVPLKKVILPASSSVVASDLPRCGGNYWNPCFGTLTLSSGAKYVGEIKENRRNGKGTQILVSGNKYVGAYKDNKRNGKGTSTYVDGRKYVGQWKDNRMNGKGTFTYPDGAKYVGQWKDGKKSGQGTFSYPDRRKYTGQWKNDKYDGQGTYTSPNGAKYVGQLKDGKYDGEGTLTFPDGTQKKGIWRDNEFQYTKTAPKDDEVRSAQSGSGTNQIFMICETEAMGERLVANGYAFHVEIDIDRKRLNWNGIKSNELETTELRFFAIMECINPENGVCLLPYMGIDRLTGNFEYQDWGGNGAYHGTCRVADKKKKLF